MRILIVEDGPRIRTFLARAFEAEGFPVDVVEDGETGLLRALSGSYVLVILDLLLPTGTASRCSVSCTRCAPSSRC